MKNKDGMQIDFDSFIGILSSKEKLNLLRALIDSYDCVSLMDNGDLGEIDTLSGKDIKLSKRTANETLEILIG